MPYPTVTVQSRKLRIESEASKYTLDLWQAQEFSSDLILGVESIDNLYNPPESTVRKRTLKVSASRSIRVTGGRREPVIQLEHAPVIRLTVDQAHELIEIIVSEIEATEARFEAKGVDPYPD